MSSVEIPQLQLKRTAQKKGQATAATVPDHGPATLEKTTMNEKDASTTAPAMANRAPIFALEEPTLELERFASILSHVSDSLFDREHRLKDHGGGIVTLLVQADTLDNVQFLISKVYGLANEIEAATTRALNDHIVSQGKGAVAGGAAINQLVARLKGNETPMQIVQVATDLARGAAA